MPGRRSEQRDRAPLGGMIVFNAGKSTIDCIVRHISEEGACAELRSLVGIPDHFDLIISGENEARPCTLEWQSAGHISLSFQKKPAGAIACNDRSPPGHPEQARELMRGETLALRTALDEIRLGIVLLDSELRAQFANREFRRMWQLPDAKANSKPAFGALMYHGYDARAYKIPAGDIDAYVAQRIALIKAGDPTPLDLHLSNGEVIRVHCAVLPDGGRMLSYTYVTDIARNSDELEVLRTALDKVQEGIILLDANLNAQLMNRAVRQLWRVPNELADSRPHYVQLVEDVRRTGAYGVAPDELDAFIAKRIELVRAGDSTPHNLHTGDGRCIRSQCTTLPSGGRMLTYFDVTDLVRNAEQLERLATIDAMSGMNNRRHFLALADAEWGRFQRYHRPLSLLMVDIDHFKSINDRYGHATGDVAITYVAYACQDGKRNSDIVGRIGGEEFAMLLPETDSEQANVVAERLRQEIANHAIAAPNGYLSLTVSIGVASATSSMSGIGALMSEADLALYAAKAQGRNRVVCLTPNSSLEHNLAAE